MATRIVEYNQQTTAQASPLPATARAGKVVSAFAEAAPAITQSLKSIEDSFENIEMENARAWTLSAASKATLDGADLLTQHMQKSQPGAGKFQETFMGDWTKYTEKTIANAPNNAAKKLMAAQLAQLTESYGLKAKEYELGEGTRWRNQQVLESADNDAKLISGMNYDEVDGEVTNSLGRISTFIANSNMTPEQKQAALDTARQTITNAGAFRKIKLDPKAMLGVTVNSRSPQDVRGDMRLPRGIRNANPGNLRPSGDKWQGAIGDDGGYLQFENPEMGLRAMAKNLLTQQEKHGLNTVEDIVSKYAPDSENPTPQYIAKVASELGVGPADKLNLKDPETLKKLMTSMIKFENGSQPYNDAQLNYGVKAALGQEVALPASAPNTSPLAAAPDRRAVTGSPTYTYGTWEQQQKWSALAESEIRSQETERRARITEGNAYLGIAKDRLEKGYALPPEESATIDAMVTSINEPEVTRRWAVMKDNQQVLTAMRDMAPDALEQLINTKLVPATLNNGASDGEFTRLEMAQSLLKNMREQVKQDPLAYAATIGANVQPLDPNKVESYAQRASTAVSVASKYDVPISRTLFSQSELSQLTGSMAKMPAEQKLALAGRMRQGFGEHFQDAMAAISEKDRVFPLAATLAAVGSPKQLGTARDILLGQGMLTADPKLAPSKTNTDPVISETVGDAFEFMPPDALPSVMEAATALYVKKVGGAPVEFDQDKYEESLLEVLGKDGKTGGIGDLNGAAYILPAGLDEDTVEVALQYATEGDLAAMAVTEPTKDGKPQKGSAPVDSFGKTWDGSRAYQEATLRPTGYGEYLLYGKDGKPMSSPTGPKGLYIIRLDPDKVKSLAGGATLKDDFGGTALIKAKNAPYFGGFGE